MSERVILIGASTNPSRYAYMATESLLNHGHEVLLYGIKQGEVLGLKIQVDKTLIPEQIDTVTLYINPTHQESWIDFILKVSPKRVLFNPGTENPAFETVLRSKGISAEHVCTLVLLSTNTF